MKEITGDGYEKLGSEKLDDYEDGEKNGGKGKTKKKKSGVWKKVKYQLVDYHALPAYMKDNEYIHRYYRAEWPIPQLLLSVFRIHNETLNIWTHLAGFFLFLFLTIYTAKKVPEVDLNSLQRLPELLRSSSGELYKDLVGCLPSFPNMHDIHRFREDLQASFSNFSLVEVLSNCLPARVLQLYVSNHSAIQGVGQEEEEMSNMLLGPLLSQQAPITRWPFYIFMGGAMFCLLSSSICHLFSCHSHRLNLTLLRIDYVGIAVMIITSFFPNIYYVFQCEPHWQFVYLGGITAMGIFTIATLLTPSHSAGKFRGLRALLFTSMGLFGFIPAVHAGMVNWSNPKRDAVLKYEGAMALFYLTGTGFYVARVPERFRPGWFDLAGHSHQIFHVLVVLGALAHYGAALVFLEYRDQVGC